METSSTPTSANDNKGTAEKGNAPGRRTAADGASQEESFEALQAALDSARLRLQQRLAEEIEQHRSEAEQLKKQVDQLRSEAESIIVQAQETAARVIAEAKQTEAQTLQQAQQQVDGLLSRLSDRAGSFLERAASEINAVQQAIASARSGSTGEAAAPAGPQKVNADEEERVVTRLVVRPSAAPEVRTRLKERLEGVPGVYAVLFGAVDDNSFEMLLAHERSASIEDRVVALAPEGVSVTDRRDGLLEIELRDTSWLESAAAASSNAA